MHACYADASCHLDVTRTLKMLERFYWWVGMEACAKWWIRRCLNCQARKLPAKRFAGLHSPSPCPTSPEYPSALTTLGPCQSLLEEIPTSFSSRTASAGGQTCSLSPPQKSQLRYCQHLGKLLYPPVGMLINSSIRQRTPTLRTTCDSRLQTPGCTQTHDKRLPP